MIFEKEKSGIDTCRSNFQNPRQGRTLVVKHPPVSLEQSKSHSAIKNAQDNNRCSNFNSTPSNQSTNHIFSRKTYPLVTSTDAFLQKWTGIRMLCKPSMRHSVTNTNRQQQQRADVILMALVCGNPSHGILYCLCCMTFPCSAVRPSSFANTSSPALDLICQATNQPILFPQDRTQLDMRPTPGNCMKTIGLSNQALSGCGISCCYTWLPETIEHTRAYSKWVPISSTIVAVASAIHWNLCAWCVWLHTFRAVVISLARTYRDNSSYKLFQDFHSFTDHDIVARWPDLVMSDKLSSCTKIIDITCMMDCHMVDNHAE